MSARASARAVIAGAGILLLELAGPPAVASQDALADAIVELRSLCAQRPARACTERVTAFLDADRDERVTFGEVDAARRAARTAVAQRDPRLSGAEHSLLAIGLLAFRQAKLETVFANFDTDRDGGLSHAELFADFRLDQRPLRAIVADPAGVDWPGLARRFGEVGFLLLDMLAPGSRAPGQSR